MRLISSSPFRAHSHPVFQNLKIHRCDLINDYLSGQFMFKFHDNKLPKIFHNMFSLNIDIHSIHTRSAGKLHLFKVRTELGKRSIRYHGAILWNKICEGVQIHRSLNCFKKYLKASLLDKQQ